MNKQCNVPEGLPIWWIEPKMCEDGDDFHAATLAWITSLGLDPARLAPTAAVVRWGGGYELHVDEVVADQRVGERYQDRFDPIKQDGLLTIRRIIPVADGSWPAMPAEVAV